MKTKLLSDNISSENSTPFGKSERWILAHDIRNPKRLNKVWRYLRKEGVRLQYSIYLINGSRRKIQEILDHLLNFIDERVDDIRVYPIGENARFWGLGNQFEEGGNMLCDEIIDKLKVSNRDNWNEHSDDEMLNFD